MDDKIQWAKDKISDGKDHDQKGLSDLVDKDNKLGQMNARINEGKTIPNAIHVDGELGALNGKMQKLLQSSGHDERLLPAFQKLHEFRTQEMPGLISNKKED